MRQSNVEYTCFGKYLPNAVNCIYGCIDPMVEACLIVTRHLPIAPIEELVEYLASPNYSIRSRAIVRLRELRCRQ